MIYMRIFLVLLLLQSKKRNRANHLGGRKLPLDHGIGHPKRNFILQQPIFRCYVSFREGISCVFPVSLRFISFKKNPSEMFLFTSPFFREVPLPPFKGVKNHHLKSPNFKDVESPCKDLGPSNWKGFEPVLRRGVSVLKMTPVSF